MMTPAEEVASHLDLEPKVTAQPFSGSNTRAGCMDMSVQRGILRRISPTPDRA